ncbi:Fe-S cluster assembly protein SufD [Phycisphaerales bacterium AB-hyl4]|uniref:Fe-S cluster assembly protein SufD n=1 Tax=Natronomicrosphaera hydrolytica TaxID=3242702 RepID=A0ABV4UB82_9BACT
MPTTAPTEAIAHYESLAKQRLDHGPAWLRPIREQAIARLADLGLPTRKHEEWRYTDPARLTQTNFTLPSDRATVTAEQVARFAIPDLDAHTLVFVNGRYVAELSHIGKLPEGVTVLPLNDALDKHRDRIEPHFAEEGEPSSKAFTALNAALCDDGVFVHIAENKQLDKPVLLLNIMAGTDEPTITNPRTFFLGDANAEGTIVERYVSLDDSVYFTNAVAHVEAGQGAHLSHYLIEEESPKAFQLSTLLTEQSRDSNVDSHTMLFGGELVRNNCNPRLNGEGGDCLVNGLYMPTDHQHMDNHMRVEHNAAHCDSRQFYKGVLNGHGRSVFSGRIRVEIDAQKTDAKQTNANLLLSDDADATTKPQLEIYADDVKCTHGATIGQIQDEAIFYLMARGVDRTSARAMLVYAFAAESLERMQLEPVRNMLGKMILHRLPQGDMLEHLLEY